jgi:hypothetical protein
MLLVHHGYVDGIERRWKRQANARLIGDNNMYWSSDLREVLYLKDSEAA